ncbi:hypothetical protein JCM9533A_73200 [Catenuloplanes niger JCM 9533]
MRGTAGQETVGQETVGQETAGQETAGQETAGQETAGRRTAGAGDGVERTAPAAGPRGRWRARCADAYPRGPGVRV